MRALTIILGLALMTGTAHAAFKGAEVQLMCASGDSYLTGYIAGYVEKLNRDYEQVSLDSATSADRTTKLRLADTAKMLKENICLPEGTTVGTILSLMCDRVRSDEYLQTAPIDGVARVAMVSAFPCERD